jgi:hypothetical protein
MERDKILMLAEMEAVEEEEEREEERMGIKDIADLAESHGNSETDTKYGNVGVLFNRRGKLLGLGGTFEQRLTRKRESRVRNQD